MKRRDFLLGSASAFLFLSAGIPEVESTRLAAVKGDKPDLITKEAIKMLGGMKRFVGRGDRVVVKPNIGWDRKPQLAANTNPLVVRAVVEMCYDAGAKEVVVIDNPCNSVKRSYNNSGIIYRAKEAGARISYPDRAKLKKVRIGGEGIKHWKVFSDFLESDKIINVPIAKHHCLTGLTLGMKNLMGCIGGGRPSLHGKISVAVADLAGFFKPVLTILDAYRVLIRNGPQGGSVSDVVYKKVVVAGTDFVAVDSYGARLMAKKPGKIGYILEAYRRGYGEIDTEKIVVEEKMAQ